MTELTGLFIPLITPFTASGEIAAAPLSPGWQDELAQVAVQVAYRQK